MARGSLERGLDILCLLASADGGLEVPTIAARCRIPTSSAYRILQSLRQRGLVDTGPAGGGFGLGIVVLQWAAALRHRLSLVQIAAPALQRLARATGETATVTLLQGQRAVVADVTDALSPLRVTSQVGRSLPLHAGASSKAILAFLPRARWRHSVGQGRLAAFTSKTITSRIRLWQECERIRSLGYAQSDEEVLEGARGVAAPIFDEKGQVCGSIALAGPRQRFRGAPQRMAAALLTREAAALSRTLGFSQPEESQTSQP
jgi:DNA-binding IclR family transcriptional regulator